MSYCFFVKISNVILSWAKKNLPVFNFVTIHFPDDSIGLRFGSIKGLSVPLLKEKTNPTSYADGFLSYTDFTGRWRKFISPLLPPIIWFGFDIICYHGYYYYYIKSIVGILLVILTFNNRAGREFTVCFRTHHHHTWPLYYDRSIVIGGSWSV